MGKKYIIELEETPFIQHFKNGAYETIYRVKGFNSLVFDWNGLQMLTPYTEPDLEQVRKEAFDEGYKEGMQLSIDDAKLKEEYRRGLDDAWDAARTLWNTPNRKEIFGHTTFNTVLTTLTAQETIEKIRQYEKEKEEQIIKGDIVRIKSAPEVEILVTCADEEYVSGIALTEVDDSCEIGDQYTDIRIHKVEKTGRHYEIVEVLKKMREE